MSITSIEKLKERSGDILAKVSGFGQIAGEEDLSLADSLITGVKGIRKEISDFFRPNIDRLNKAHLEAIRQMRHFDSPLVEGEKKIKKLVGDYFAEVRRRNEEAAAAAQKAEEERKKIEEQKLREALEAEEKGEKEEALKIIEQVPESAPAPVFEKPKMKNVYTRQRPRWRVADEKRIPRNFLMPNGAKITEYVEQTKGKIEIPGIEIYFADEVVGRSG
jgi:hypothetical protein